MPQNLLNAVKAFGNSKQHALVIGDVMLDRYLIGDVGRISPEAPVPIVLLKEQNERAGGAANVAANLALLGIKTHIVGCVGNDAEATILQKLITNIGIDATDIVKSKKRPTIAKTRILGGHQQMMRLDQESQSAFSVEENAHLLSAIKTQLALKPAIVILSDYAKGLLSESICQQIIAQCKTQRIPVLVDPKGRDYSKYQGATALTPNRQEAAEACGVSAKDTDALLSAAYNLRQKLELKFLAITRSEEGISLLETTRTTHIPAVAKHGPTWSVRRQVPRQPSLSTDQHPSLRWRERTWRALIQRTVPVAERMTTLSVVMKLPLIWTPSSMEPSVTPVAANTTSPDAISISEYFLFRSLMPHLAARSRSTSLRNTRRV